MKALLLYPRFPQTFWSYDRLAFIEETAIPQPMLGVLQAIPNTALWQRLKEEERLL